MGDDLTLLAAWRAGDREAGSRLLRRHLDRVYGFFATHTPPDVAEELTQWTFETCIGTRDRIRPEVSLRAYLLGIARNKLMQHQDRWRRRGNLSTDVCESLVAPGPSASAVVANNEQQRLLLRALARLPLDAQVALELHYWESLSVDEIAHVLGIAPGTVKSRLARARARLEQTLCELESDASVIDSTVRDLDRWISSLRKHVGDVDD